jgi:hypothetical protein
MAAPRGKVAPVEPGGRKAGPPGGDRDRDARSTAPGSTGPPGQGTAQAQPAGPVWPAWVPRLSNEEARLLGEWLATAPGSSGSATWTGFSPRTQRLTGLIAPPFSLDPAAPVRLSTGACPGPCHQVNEAMHQQAERRAAEQRAAERQAHWKGLVEGQSHADLDAEPGSLQDEIDVSVIAVAQARKQLFDRALAEQWRSGSVPPSPGVTGLLTPAMRDAWARAETLAAVLEASLRVDETDIPVALASSFRIALREYYATMPRGLRALDTEDEQLAARVKGHPCPGDCHGSAPATIPASPGSGLLGGFSNPLSPAGSAFPAFRADRGPAIDLSMIDPSPGPREKRLASVVERLSGAGSAAEIQAAIKDFHWVTSTMDALIRARVPAIEAKDELAQLDYASGLLERQREFLTRYPLAIRVPAVFYPDADVLAKADDLGAVKESARAIPWQFYLTRTPLDPRPTLDPRPRVPAGFEWQLHDITAPVQGRPLIRVSKRLTAIEALEYERRILTLGQNAHDIDVLPDLFEQLDTPDFFTKGVLHWHSPIDGRYRSTTMHEDTPLGVWLTRIGMAVAILGSLIFAPYSTPLLLSVGAGTGLMIAGRLIRLDEQQRHGVLKDSDVRQFFWDLAMDIVSAMTLGFGRVVAVANTAGTLARGSALARSYFLLRRVELGMQVLNVGVITNDFIDQYQMIASSSMTDEQKREAYVSLGKMAMFSGLITLVPLRSNIKHIDQLPRLRFATEAGTGRMVGEADSLGEEAGHGQARTSQRAQPLHQERVLTPTGETHTFVLWSDGRITRCSPGPCGLLTDSIVHRIGELQERTLSDSAHLSALDDLATRARQMREEARAVAGAASAELRKSAPGIMSRAKELETEIAALEKQIATENAASERTGREEAEKLYGPAALEHGPHYGWRRYRKTGELVLQRRTKAVPWMDFNPKTGKFFVTKTLFVAVDAAELERLRATGATRDFPILATITTRAELDRLRPVTATGTAPADWVVVKISDDNLVHFIDEPIRRGVIYEYPDGSRAWRSPRNTVMTDSKVRPAIGRRGFEQGLPSASAPGGLDLSATGVEHQRSHPAGNITGFEISGHIPYAPTYVNQSLQAQGIELFLSELSARHPELDLRFGTEHAKIPRTLRQEWIEYTVVAGNAPRRNLMKVRITTDYANPARPAKVDLGFLTSDADDLERLLDVDMPAALADLQRRIAAGRQRREQARRR